MAETILPNGLCVLTEGIPGVRSAAVGVWVRQGAAHERPKVMGASHLLEHMVFKGTRCRTAREIALALESLGGSLDAYTSREHTSYQARVLDEHLPQALDVLADLVLDPLLRDADLALEKEVVLEEIATVEDTPDDLVFDLHGARFWNDHPYGHSILGSRETVADMPGDALRGLHQDTYRGRNLLVAAAGNVQHTEVVDRVGALFGSVPAGETAQELPDPPPPPRGEEHIRRDSAQSHLVFGGAIPSHSDPRRYALVLLSQVLGGGMSSRLFQRIREELALAYSVYTFQSFYARGGLFGIYVGTRPRTVRKAADTVREELARIAEKGLSELELDQTKQQVKGQIMLSLESTGARLFRLAGFALHRERFIGLDELLGRFDALTLDEVSLLAGEFLSPERHFLLSLGPTG
ncbi:M16 family metallopeptidase [Gemmatimonadota bacterium]